MNYTVLIYEAADDFAARTDPSRQQSYRAGWAAYTKVLREAGVFVSGAGLEPPATATTLKIENGKRTVQDGPYADTKEQLGGFYIIDVPDLDSALNWASRGPYSPGCRIEVRPNLAPRPTP